MRRQASPELLRSVAPDELRNRFAQFARLGPLVAYLGAHGDNWQVSTSTGSGAVITVHFVAQATFVHGAAAIDVVVTKAGGVWKIRRFNVASPATNEHDVGRSI
jgi:hypothetical protein